MQVTSQSRGINGNLMPRMKSDAVRVDFHQESVNPQVSTKNFQPHVKEAGLILIKDHSEPRVSHPDSISIAIEAGNDSAVDANVDAEPGCAFVECLQAFA